MFLGHFVILVYSLSCQWQHRILGHEDLTFQKQVPILFALRKHWNCKHKGLILCSLAGAESSSMVWLLAFLCLSLAQFHAVCLWDGVLQEPWTVLCLTWGKSWTEQIKQMTVREAGQSYRKCQVGEMDFVGSGVRWETFRLPRSQVLWQLAVPCQLSMGAIPGTGVHLSWTSYKAQFSLVMVPERVIWVQMEQKQWGKRAAGQTIFWEWIVIKKEM